VLEPDVLVHKLGALEPLAAQVAAVLLFLLLDRLLLD